MSLINLNCLACHIMANPERLSNVKRRNSQSLTESFKDNSIIKPPTAMLVHKVKEESNSTEKKLKRIT